MQKTNIGWTDYSSNPIRVRDRRTGKMGWHCHAVSAGCDHCYAQSLNQRWGTGTRFDPAEDEHLEWVLVEHEIAAMLRPRPAGKVFICDMTDLFHADIPRAYIDTVFAAMVLAKAHTFQVLTKRPQRAVRYLRDASLPDRLSAEVSRLYVAHRECFPPPSRVGQLYWTSPPLPNLWLGTSVERNEERHRIRTLVQAPAVVHFLSCEPLIGPLDLAARLPFGAADWSPLDDIEWVISGGESGPEHRPFDPAWAAAIRDACLARGVPFFHKQNGGLTPKSGGRLLDGRTWDEFPPVAEATGQMKLGV